MTVIDFATRRNAEQQHESLIAAADELHRLCQRRLTPATMAQMRFLHTQVGALLDALHQ